VAEYKLKTPVSEDAVRKLNVGDTIYITGLILTARDQAHKRILEYDKKKMVLPVKLEGSAIFHCGPVIKEEDGKWEVVAGGPTTSARMNTTAPEVIEKFKVRIIIGKGGMGSEVVNVLRKRGAIYCHFTGGAGVLAAKNIKEVEGVEWSDLGMAEAVWKLRAENFGPLIVTIDSHGKSIYDDVNQKVADNLKKIYKKLE